MKSCNGKDCLNCTLEKCIYDTDGEQSYRVIKGGIPGLGERIRKILHKKHLSQRQLSKRTSIAEPTITAYVNNKRIPRANHIVVICNELGCSADWLLGLEK